MQTERIGRYLFVIGEIKSREQLGGWWNWLRKRAEKVTLANRQEIFLNAKESTLLDQAIVEHNELARVYSMCRTLGARI